MTFKMNGWSGWSPLKNKIKQETVDVDEVVEKNYQKVKGRKGVRKNPDGSHSTHLMSDNNKKEAWPTLFQNEDGSWIEGGYDEAKKRDEIYKFANKQEMINFARKGNWKNE
jgi:hypothetical protein